MGDSFQEPEFWDSRYRAQDAPWELAHAPRQLLRWMGSQPSGGSVLIPGCGSGREVCAFARAGWKVTGIDFSATAIARARANAEGASATLIVDDFFTYPFIAGMFDLIYERTFLTALSPERWPACAERYWALLKPDGRIAGYCYYGHEADPPPFFQPPGEPPAFAGAFELEVDAVSEDALPFFGERERWQVWRRKDVMDRCSEPLNTA
jgi:thiopurine S-methyltransferase